MENNIYNLMKRINKESKKPENKFNTGLVGEQLIVASYKQMPLDKLEKMRFIINKIIKEKKEFIRVANAQASSNIENNDKSNKNNEVPMMIDSDSNEE
jgi:hypothetical protein